MSQFRDSSGYAVAARGYLKALDAYLTKNPGSFELKVHTFNVEREKKLSSHMLEILDKYEFKSVNEVKKLVQGDYILLWHMPPPMISVYTKHFAHKDIQWQVADTLMENSTHNINLTVWEADKIPDHWIRLFKKLNTQDVIVPSKWNKEVFSKQLGDINCHLVAHLLDKKRVMTDSKPLRLPFDIEDKFVVLSMSQWNERKGFDKLILSFCIEFAHQQDVVLLIKTYLDNTKYQPENPKAHYEHISRQASAWKNGIFLDEEERPTAKVVIVPDVLPTENITWLHQNSDAFCLLTRGEGFGYTVAESMMHSNPVIVSDPNIFFDYLDLEKIKREYGTDPALEVSGHWSPYVNRPGYSANSNWFEPHILDARRGLRNAYNIWKNDKKSFDKLGKCYYNSVMNSDSFNELGIANKLVQIFESKWSTLPETGVLKTSEIVPKVKETTSHLKWELQKIDNPIMSQRRLNLLKNAYEGETCYILNCGPSLNEYSAEFLDEFLKDKLTFAVKQAYHKAPNVVDFHFFNCSNLPQRDKVGSYYNYYNPYGNRPISVASSNYDFGRRWEVMDQECDLFFKIPIRTKINNEFLVRTLKFDRFTLDNTINRPCGPGIMYETVLYMAEYLGVKEIVVLGWDLGRQKNYNPGNYKHFYGTSKKTVNQGDILGWEIDQTREASKPLAEWLDSKGIKLKLASSQSSLWKGIERTKLEIK